MFFIWDKRTSSTTSRALLGVLVGSTIPTECYLFFYVHSRTIFAFMSVLYVGTTMYVAVPYIQVY